MGILFEGHSILVHWTTDVILKTRSPAVAKE